MKSMKITMVCTKCKKTVTVDMRKRKKGNPVFTCPECGYTTTFKLDEGIVVI